MKPPIIEVLPNKAPSWKVHATFLEQLVPWNAYIRRKLPGIKFIPASGLSVKRQRWRQHTQASRLLWDSIRNNIFALVFRVTSCISRSITFPLAFVFEWRNRRFERRGVAARRRELLGIIPRGSSVLEVGAGSGATLSAGAYTGSIGRFSRIVFTEPDPGMRARLKKKACSTEERIEVFDAALPHLPFEDESFDAVVAFMVLSYVADRRKSLEEISRILKPGGKLLLMDHAAHPDERQIVEQDSFFWFKEWYKFVHVRGARKAQLEVLISDISKHESLEVDFLSRMETHGLFQEICYGTYTKKKS